MESSNEQPSQMFSRGLLELFKELEAIAGYAPPVVMTKWFFALQQHLFGPMPIALAHLKPNSDSAPDWLARCRHGILGDVQEGLYSSLYHLTRVEQIESGMLAIAKKHAPNLEMLPASGAGGGNSRALNAEYQAFAFAIRRTLDYLAVAAAAYFKTECHSIRKLSAAVNARAPQSTSIALRAFLSAQLPNISDVIPGDKHKDRSIRDRLAHWQSVSAGSFSISRAPWGYDVSLIGGGHDLPVFRPQPAGADRADVGGMVTYTALGPLLRSQFERVERVIYGALDALNIGSPN